MGTPTFFSSILWSKTSVSDLGTLQYDVMRQLAFLFHKFTTPIKNNTVATGTKHKLKYLLSKYSCVDFSLK